uniref:Ion transport domain-containing protein n=1 Tax=Acrobeloides nanus TaxID=290746 RepID=A0A914DFJ8_9BILA
MPLPEGISFTRKKPIKFRRKLYEFFVAPITTFWAWSLNFLVFLTIFTYVLLIKTPPFPTFLEWYLCFYVLVFGLEIIRRFFTSEPEKLREKLAYFFVNYWNALTTLAIVMFLSGFTFRLVESTM